MGIDSQSFIQGMALLGAGVAAIGCLGGGVGCGTAAGKAVEGVSRQPEARGQIISTMIIGAALSEATSIYALLVALLLIAKG
ncbi:MAG: ATP synthase F0 subunit C [Solirubrobacterales bacterium]